MRNIVHKTWLLDGIFHSAPGYIEIDNSMFSFSLVGRGTFSEKKLLDLEAYSNTESSIDFLKKEEPVQLINTELGVKAKY